MTATAIQAISPKTIPSALLFWLNSLDRINAHTILERAAPVVIERLIPPVRTAIIMAIAIRPNSGIWNIMVFILFPERNLSGDRILISTKIPIKIIANVNSLECLDLKFLKKFILSIPPIPQHRHEQVSPVHVSG